MLRQSSSRNYRSSKKLIRPRHSFQAVLLLAVGVWIVYQLARSSYGQRRAAVAVETGDGNDGGEAEARRRLGRKGLVGGFADQVGSDDDDFGRSQSQGDDGLGDADALSKDEDREGDGDEEGQATEDEDDGADDEDDDLAVDEEDDDFLLSMDGNSEDELKTALGESDRAAVFDTGDGDGTLLHEPDQLNSSVVPRAKATGSVQDAAAVGQQRNATDSAAGRSAKATDLSENVSSVKSIAARQRNN